METHTVCLYVPDRTPTNIRPRTGSRCRLPTGWGLEHRCGLDAVAAGKPVALQSSGITPSGLRWRHTQASRCALGHRGRDGDASEEAGDGCA